VTVVVDASVVAAAFFQEDHHLSARRILASDNVLHAPDLLVAEVGNVIWKRHGRGEISATEASELLDDVLRLPITYTPATALATPAMAIALRAGRTVYDSLYVALAISQNTVMYTADQRLVNTLAQSPLAAHVVSIAKLPT